MSNPSALSLACLLVPRCLGFGHLPSLSALGLTCFADLHYLGLGRMPCPNALGLTCLSDHITLDLADYQVQVLLV
jgi:hypothetical protein